MLLPGGSRLASISLTFLTRKAHTQPQPRPQWPAAPDDGAAHTHRGSQACGRSPHSSHLFHTQSPPAPSPTHAATFSLCSLTHAAMAVSHLRMEGRLEKNSRRSTDNPA